MISTERAWTRISKLPMFKGFQLSDFRTITYGQTFSVLAAATSAAVTQNFPAGAVLLGVGAAASPNSGAVAADPNLLRHSFALSFSYTNGEALTPGGPILADALLGSGETTIWPQKEIVLAPNQGIQATVQNF